MGLFNTIIYILIGVIGGRAIVNKDWVTLVVTIVLFVVHAVNEWLKKEKQDGHTD